MCTSPIVRLRSKMPLPKSCPIQFDSVGFSYVSLKKLQAQFKSFSDMYECLNNYFDYQYIKCRKCDECKGQYARDWSIRAYHEFQMRKVGCFVTLTVDSAKAHIFTDNLKGYCKRCVKGNRFFKYPIDYSLNKGLLQDWIKKLRDNLFKRYGIQIRYFGCGEYGSEQYTERAHYHIIIFGYDFKRDRVPYKMSKSGYQLFLSEELSKSWPYGIATLQDVTAEICSYTAKYVTKKLKFNNDMSEFEAYYGRQPEFLIMSRGNCQSNRCPFIDEIIKNCKGLNSLRNLNNPYCKLCDKTRGGLGYDWLWKYLDDMLKLGYIVIDSKKYPIPKYYFDVLKLTDIEIYDRLKIVQRLHKDELDEEHPEYNSVEHLEVKKKVIKNRLKHYHRA